MHNGAGPAVLSVVAGASSAVVAARSKAATAASAIGGPSPSGRCMMKTSTLAFRSAALPFVVSSAGTTTDTSAAVDARDGRLATKMRHTGGRGPQRRMRSTTASSPECLYRVLVGPYPRCRKRVPCAVCRVPCAVCRVPRAACRVPCAYSDYTLFLLQSLLFTVLSKVYVLHVDTVTVLCGVIPDGVVLITMTHHYDSSLQFLMASYSVYFEGREPVGNEISDQSGVHGVGKETSSRPCHH